MKLAIINKEKCRPTLCGHECKKSCPVEKKESDSCVTVGDRAVIDENTCIGCGICSKRCPFGAIDIINLPSVSSKDLVHRYGQNGFALYGLPVPKEGKILGLLGRNGIGKTTAVKLLSGTEQINLGSEASEEDVMSFFKGNEILRYLKDMKEKKISYKPQNLSKLVVDVKVIDLLKQRGSEEEILRLADRLEISNVLENKMDKLSGGELQKVAILAASLGKSSTYFFDEPLAFLDIKQRLSISDFMKDISKESTLIVVEHDLLILDYLTDYLNIFFGGQGSYGRVSGLKTSKEGVNAYLRGFLKEENMRIRDKEINFNFTKNPAMSGNKISNYPGFYVKFDTGFELKVGPGEIKQNHVIGILGKNGTGKSTFVKALAGEVEVEVDGEKKKLDLNLNVSYKPQYLFTQEETLVRDVCFKEKIGKKLKMMFNIGVLESKKINELSGGELQRLGVARCLARDADVYLIDEPSAYLDVEERISVAKAIKDIMVEKEKTAFVVDHDLLLVSYLADSIINFDGESGKNGTASEIRNFEEGVSELLKSLNVTLRKEPISGRPRINKKGSVKDREQKENGQWVIL